MKFYDFTILAYTSTFQILSLLNQFGILQKKYKYKKQSNILNKNLYEIL